MIDQLLNSDQLDSMLSHLSTNDELVTVLADRVDVSKDELLTLLADRVDVLWEQRSATKKLALADLEVIETQMEFNEARQNLNDARLAILSAEEKVSSGRQDEVYYRMQLNNLSLNELDPSYESFRKEFLSLHRQHEAAVKAQQPAAPPTPAATPQPTSVDQPPTPQPTRLPGAERLEVSEQRLEDMSLDEQGLVRTQNALTKRADTLAGEYDDLDDDVTALNQELDDLVVIRGYLRKLRNGLNSKTEK